MDIYQLAAIVVPVLTIVSIAIVKVLLNFKKCLDKQDKRTFRISKALSVMAHRSDDIDEDQHGKKNNLGPEVDKILQDSHGNY